MSHPVTTANSANNQDAAAVDLAGASTPLPTPLAAALAEENAAGTALRQHCGRLTPDTFSTPARELDALLHQCGVADLGWRSKVLVTGSDRLRWLNGMVSNTVQGLGEGHGNYNFLLSNQGRIQGDCCVYRRAEDLLLETSADQLAAVMSHLDHFIIMDDVELSDVSAKWSSLALIGPAAPRVLEALGVAIPVATATEATITTARIGEIACTVVAMPKWMVPHFEVWFAPEHVLAVWETLQAAGALACGLEASEALRILEGIPLYGVDLNERDLPQETAQTRALNFSKGCYLGQEIVERIRSRGKVNRQLRQFSLEGGLSSEALPLELRSGADAVGRVTSICPVPVAGITGTLGLGFARVEIVERGAEISFNGGKATPLVSPLQIPGLVSASK